MDLKAAKQLFFRYDGSLFFMSRDGVDDSYRQAHVPTKIEQQWLEELTRRKVEGLDAPRNWSTVHFLRHHSDFKHSQLLLETEPKGKLWERTAYVEELVRYVRSGNEIIGEPSGLKSARKVILDKATNLLMEAKSNQTRERIEALIRSAGRLAESEPAP